MSGFRRLALTPLGKAPVVVAIVLGAVVPIAVAVLALSRAQNGDVSPAAVLVFQAVVALVTMSLLLPLWRREASFDGQRLRVKSTLYTREAPLEDFLLDQARVVDLRDGGEFRPFIKTNGVHLPGFLSGHFRLRNWRKAFCLVSDRAKVLALPHRDGRVWLISLQHPQAVLDILRRPRA